MNVKVKGLNTSLLPVFPMLLSLNLSELSILIASRILLLKSATAAALSCCPLIWSLMGEMIQCIQNLNEWNAPMLCRPAHCNITSQYQFNTYQHRFSITNVCFQEYIIGLCNHILNFKQLKKQMFLFQRWIKFSLFHQIENTQHNFLAQ